MRGQGVGEEFPAQTGVAKAVEDDDGGGVGGGGFDDHHSEAVFNGALEGKSTGLVTKLDSEGDMRVNFRVLIPKHRVNRVYSRLSRRVFGHFCCD